MQQQTENINYVIIGKEIFVTSEMCSIMPFLQIKNFFLIGYTDIQSPLNSWVLLVDLNQS